MPDRPPRLRGGKRRKPSSRRWLERQLKDPFVAEARRRGYRSRAAFKLIGLDERARLLRPGLRVLDLGAAPGGWTQVAVERVRPGAGGGKVVAVDVAAMAPVAGALLVEGDLREASTVARIREALAGGADLVMSDLSPAATGMARADHLRIVVLVEAAAELALEVLAPGGAFVAKVLAGGAEQPLLAKLKRAFAKVRHIKPAASRKESAEIYLVATGFRG